MSPRPCRRPSPPDRPPRPEAKQALNAAAVIGLRFEESLLTDWPTPAAVEPLLKAELIDQVAFTPRPEYAFRHPLIRAVAYRSQLASARAELASPAGGGPLEDEDPGFGRRTMRP